MEELTIIAEFPKGGAIAKRKNGEKVFVRNYFSNKLKSIFCDEKDIEKNEKGLNVSNWRSTKPLDFDKLNKKEINKFIDERLKKPFLFYFAEKFFKNNELEIIKDEIYPIQKKVARKFHLKLVDLYSPLEHKVDSTCYVWDNVHLNKSGSLILAEHIYKAITGKKAPKLENAFAN